LLSRVGNLSSNDAQQLRFPREITPPQLEQGTSVLDRWSAWEAVRLELRKGLVARTGIGQNGLDQQRREPQAVLVAIDRAAMRPRSVGGGRRPACFSPALNAAPAIEHVLARGRPFCADSPSPPGGRRMPYSSVWMSAPGATVALMIGWIVVVGSKREPACSAPRALATLRRADTATPSLRRPRRNWFRRSTAWLRVPG
jgi:hypothetical protein